MDESVTVPKEDLMPKKTLAVYYVLLFVSIAVAVLGVLFRNIGDLIVIIPMILIQLDAIVRDKHTVHIPPFIIVMMVLTFFISYVGQYLRTSYQIGFLSSILVGINLELIGLVLIYRLMGSAPRDNQQDTMVLFVSECIAIAIYTVMKVVQYYVSQFWEPMDPVIFDIMMEGILGVIAGALIIGVIFHFDSTHRFFERVMNRFLRGNIPSEFEAGEKERKQVLNIIRMGETDKTEFKSTIRTNLETGETDKRMEKAVLKTMTAFMNTDGGTLLVGVSDSGEILGLAVDNFESADKMNLHFTHMIANAIGNEYLPYIRFTQVDFDGKVVMMVICEKCKKPVFLKEGKNEIFFVRSGPSSIELTGKNLVNYVGNRSKKSREKVLEDVYLE